LPAWRERIKERRDRNAGDIVDRGRALRLSPATGSGKTPRCAANGIISKYGLSAKKPGLTIVYAMFGSAANIRSISQSWRVISDG
jgi:hypothetical protein